MARDVAGASMLALTDGVDAVAAAAAALTPGCSRHRYLPDDTCCSLTQPLRNTPPLDSIATAEALGAADASGRHAKSSPVRFPGTTAPDELSTRPRHSASTCHVDTSTGATQSESGSALPRTANQPAIPTTTRAHTRNSESDVPPVWSSCGWDALASSSSPLTAHSLNAEATWRMRTNAALATAPDPTTTPSAIADATVLPTRLLRNDRSRHVTARNCRHISDTHKVHLMDRPGDAGVPIAGQSHATWCQ